ncbi:MAG: SLBB domain-containing protein [Candidatus Cloacimonetes bacterium]|nr:SLBB domain-containing protein [Candidatus Cloacimonadota bacterium]
MKKTGSIILILTIIFSLSAQLPTVISPNLMIKVSLTGAIDCPGVYSLEAGSRLSEALWLAEQANRELKSSEDKQICEEEDENALSATEYSKRNIELRRNGEIIHIDLQKYLLQGDLRSNPQLRDNDLIYLPAGVKNLSIWGAVNASGEYELLAGDRITDLIDLALGISESARKDSASLVRIDYHTGEIQEYYFSPAAILSARQSPDNRALQSGDRIYIRSLAEYESKFKVTIAGNALYPGEYAIEPGKTTLSAILRKSGGASRFGNLKNAYLQRISERDTTVIFDPEYQRLKDMNYIELTQMEREYLKFKERELAGKIAVNFETLGEKGSGNADIILQDNDYIYIPDQVTSVEVSGAVMYPGAYKWQAGKNFEYYVELAGGYTNQAHKSKIRLIMAESGSWLKKDKNYRIDQGDKIFVPEKEEIEIWEITKETLSIMAQLATVIIAIRNINTN